MKSIARGALRRVHPVAERVFRSVERTRFSRGSVLFDIPPAEDREGGLGTVTYGEWCYTIGMFQTLIFSQIQQRPIRMLDVGCGTGRLFLAAKSYLTEEDQFVGLDVNKQSIEVCQKRYRSDNVRFIHHDSDNPYYANGAGERHAWQLEDDSQTLVTALSVWTHLSEPDWRFYLNEVARVLAPGGRAIISFFVLDDLYKPETKTANISRFYPQPEKKWIFDTPAYDSTHWFYPSWAPVPEVAIAVNETQFRQALDQAGLRLESFYPGQWKDQPGFFFQDVAVLSKQ